MAKEFNNNKNTAASDLALKSVIWIGFMVSTITSSVSLGFAIIPSADSFIASVIGDFYANNSFFMKTLSWGAISVAIFLMCNIIDFKIISTIGKFFATEAFALFGSYKGVFARFSIFRTAAAIFAGLIFCAGFTLSFVTSVNGANLIKVFVAPKVDAKQYDAIIAERDKQAVSATKTQDEKLAKLEADKKAAIANAGTKQLRSNARKGNIEAAKELEKLRVAAKKSYDAQIAATEKARTAAAASFEERYKGVEKAKIAAADADVEKTISQAGTIGALTKGFGVLPLIIGVLGMIILSISEVAAQAPSTSSRRVSNAAFTPPPSRSRNTQSSGDGYANFR
jgi:hypothetical protein